MKVTDRLVIHGTIIGAVTLIALAIVGNATCQAELGGILRQRKEGRAFGAAHPWSDCIQESIRRLPRRALGDKGLAEQRAFLSTCLTRAGPPDGGCAALPRFSDFDAGDAWGEALCADAGAFSKWNCEITVKTVLRTCDGWSDADAGP